LAAAAGWTVAIAARTTGAISTGTGSNVIFPAVMRETSSTSSMSCA
jgi:hypothetical protein